MDNRENEFSLSTTNGSPEVFFSFFFTSRHKVGKLENYPKYRFPPYLQVLSRFSAFGHQNTVHWLLLLASSHSRSYHLPESHNLSFLTWLLLFLSMDPTLWWSCCSLACYVDGSDNGYHSQRTYEFQKADTRQTKPFYFRSCSWQAFALFWRFAMSSSYWQSLIDNFHNVSKYAFDFFVGLLYQ